MSYSRIMYAAHPLDLILNRGDNPGGNQSRAQQSGSQSAESRAKAHHGYVSAMHTCQTADASKLCIFDAILKLNEGGDYHIGGTYAGTEPELWFYITTSLCHGKNRLLNLFVYHRKPGTFSLQISNSNELTQKIVDDDVPQMLLPSTLTSGITYRSTKPNQSYFIKTFCFSCDIATFNQNSTLMIPIKIVVNPKFVLNEDIVKSIKLQHDLSGLLTKQEKTDIFLESETHKKFPTHKILLAAHSPVLRNMIKNAQVTSLFIDISDNDMELLLEFIYTGTIKDVLKQDCLKLLEIADRFELRPLFMLTQHVIGDQINVSNAVEMAVIAKKYHLEELQNKVFDFIIKNPEVMKTDAWMNLKDVELTKYLFQYMHTMRD